MSAFAPPDDFAAAAFAKWTKTPGADSEVYLVYGGATGWLGGLLVTLLKDSGKTVHIGEARLENREAILRDFEKFKPTRVLNAAGVTGRPNVDWCEDNKQTVIRTNIIGTLNLADICWNKEIHCTLYATGCIFEYDTAHPIGGPGFTEEDRANFDGSFYSKPMGFLEAMLRSHNTTLTLRARMPTSATPEPSGGSFVAPGRSVSAASPFRPVAPGSCETGRAIFG